MAGNHLLVPARNLWKGLPPMRSHSRVGVQRVAHSRGKRDAGRGHVAHGMLLLRRKWAVNESIKSGYRTRRQESFWSTDETPLIGRVPIGKRANSNSLCLPDAAQSQEQTAALLCRKADHDRPLKAKADLAIYGVTPYQPNHSAMSLLVCSARVISACPSAVRPSLKAATPRPK